MANLSDFDFDFIMGARQYNLAKLGTEQARSPKRILVVGLGGGSDIFAAYAISRQLHRSHPKATVMFANTKSNYSSRSKELRGFSRVRDCLWSAPSEVVPLTCDRHGTTLERSCPRGPEGSPLLFVLPAEGIVRLSQKEVGVVVGALLSLTPDLVVGVDLGGDSVSGGVEGRHDAEAGRDRQMLSCIRASGLPSLHVVLGPGCDGETEAPVMRACCARLASEGSLLGVFSALPLFDDMVTQCNTAVLSPTRTPNLMWRAHTGELPSVKGTADCVCIPRDRHVCIPREWLLHGLVFSYGPEQTLRKPVMQDASEAVKLPDGSTRTTQGHGKKRPFVSKEKVEEIDGSDNDSEFSSSHDFDVDDFYVCKRILETLTVKLKKGDAITRDDMENLSDPKKLPGSEIMVKVAMNTFWQSLSYVAKDPEEHWGMNEIIVDNGFECTVDMDAVLAKVTLKVVAEAVVKAKEAFDEQLDSASDLEEVTAADLAEDSEDDSDDVEDDSDDIEDDSDDVEDDSDDIEDDSDDVEDDSHIEDISAESDHDLEALSQSSSISPSAKRRRFGRSMTV